MDGITATTAELNYCDGVTSNIQTQRNGKAASSHGNHVPATQTANNATFLRNDNTWQKVTPANIGAATSGHNHDGTYLKIYGNFNQNVDTLDGTYSTPVTYGPDGGWANVLSLQGEKFKAQLAIQVNSNTSAARPANLWVRDMYKSGSNVWCNWQQIPTCSASNIFDGEQKFYFSQYGLTPAAFNDTAGGIAAGFKGNRGFFNEMLVDKIIAPAGSGKVSIQKYTGTSGGNPTGQAEFAHFDSSDGALTWNGTAIIKAGNGNKAIWLRSGNESSLHTTADNVSYLGLSSYRWKSVYAATSTIQTSDRNRKENINPIEQRYIELFDKLQPVSYELIGKEHDRVHIGFISQDVKEAMDEVGISDTEFAAYCRDEKKEIVKEETVVYVDEEGNEQKAITDVEKSVLDENGNPEYIYSLRYEEFIALFIY
jgi:hypothetical protein